MKYLNDTPEAPKVAMRGDAVVTVTPDGTAIVGTVHELYDRNLTVRISGYPLQVKSADCLLALDAYKGFVSQFKAKKEA